MRIQPPNFTQIPNIIFEEWLPLLGHAELKVLMVIMRKTFGWHKMRDRISLSQLEKITGLERRHVCKAIRQLLSRHLIEKIVNGKNGEQETFYELVIDDSNNSYQCLSDTPPSVFRTPTKETLTKETQSPITPKGGATPRKKIQEEKIERTQEVFLTQTQHENVLKRCNGDEKLREAVYDELSIWKIGKGITGGRSDFKACIGWALEEARKKKTNNPLEKNKAITDKILKRYPHHPHINHGYNYIEIVRGATVKHMKFADAGFIPQLEAALKEININVKDFL